MHHALTLACVPPGSGADEVFLAELEELLADVAAEPSPKLAPAASSESAAALPPVATTVPVSVEAEPCDTTAVPVVTITLRESYHVGAVSPRYSPRSPVMSPRSPRDVQELIVLSSSSDEE